PVFMEPGTVFSDVNPTRRFWTLDRAVQYLLGTANARQEFVENPEFHTLESLLRNRRPVPGSDFFDPRDPATYEEFPIKLRDIDVTNLPWPEAVDRLLAYGGFGMRWVLENDPADFPRWILEVYRKDNSGPNEPKELNYARTGSNLTDAVADFTGL